jgi:microcystin-dependent protein
MDEMMGTIIAVGFTWTPKSWMPCDGRLLPISQYSALFSLLGTTYGGDGVATFALPNLQSRSGVGMTVTPGNLGGLSPIAAGEKSGSESVTMTSANMPLHSHPATVALPCTTAQGAQASPQGAIPAITHLDRAEQLTYSPPSAADAVMATANVAVGPAGGSTPVGLRNPYLGLNFIICVEGIYPSRP